MWVRIKSGFLILWICCAKVLSQSAHYDDIISVSSSVDRFTFKLLAETSRLGGKSMNIALSPYTIWTLMAIIAEGAHGNTLHELENVLHLPKFQKDIFRRNYQQLSYNLLSNAPGVSLQINNAIFVTNEFPLNETFKRLSETAYNVGVTPIDFRDVEAATSSINSFVARATANRIPSLVNTEDLVDAAIFMTSVLFFKGLWRYPFNKTATSSMPFFDDDGQTVLGTVEMMYQSATFPYSAIEELNSFAVELPYGDEGKYSMIVVVPKKNQPLDGVLKTLSDINIGLVLDKLAQAQQDYEDDEIEVFLPKFSIQSELMMNVVLTNLGIKDVFNPQKADLLGIFPQYLYLSRLLQKAVIDVDEVGTVAASAAGAGLNFKIIKPKLMANKPFAYFIVDKVSRSVIFAGKISKPKGICAKCT